MRNRLPDCGDFKAIISNHGLEWTLPFSLPLIIPKGPLNMSGSCSSERGYLHLSGASVVQCPDPRWPSEWAGVTEMGTLSCSTADGNNGRNYWTV